MQWPIFYKNEIEIGNGSAAVCTLWTKKKIIRSKLNGNFSVCANLYTIQGINPMIKNILAKPQIRKIILCGADLMKSGVALLNLMKNGIDENRKIIGSSGFVDKNIPLDSLEKFRENVKVIDMRGREKNIQDELDKTENQPAFMKPLFITELEKTSYPLYTKETGFKFYGNNMTDVWLQILDFVMKYGDEKDTEYKMKMKEIIDVVAVIKGDEEMSRFLEKSDVDNYYNTIFSKIKPKDIEYTYGERLFSYNGVDQIKKISELIKKTSYTRRAISVIWDVLKDSVSENPPCLTQIVWNVKDNKLHQTCIFRSHDIFGAWLLNIYAMRKIQKQVSEFTEIDIGNLIIISNSAHIYEPEWKKSEDIIHDNYTSKIVNFEEDENGYFVITVENEIIVQHHLKDGRKSNYLFRGKKAQLIYRQICHENLFTRFDHAAYIGHELARAENCLKQGEKFVQDEA